MKMRKKLRRIPKRKLIFIDQSRIEMGASSRRSLAAPGEEAYVSIEKAGYYPQRIDFMGVVSYDKVLSLEVSPPTKRSAEGRKGYRKQNVLDFIRMKVARALSNLNEDNLIFLLDKALRITATEVTEALQAGGCTSVAEVMILPTASGKHLSPLDNCLWHQVKDCVRRKAPQTEDKMVSAIRRCWKQITKTNLHNYYRHCGLTRREDVSKDLVE